MANEKHIRHCMLYKYQFGRKANKAAECICCALNQDAVVVSENPSIGLRNREGSFSLNDENGRFRASNFDKEALQTLLVKNLRIMQ